jgi:hypothetical protein
MYNTTFLLWSDKKGCLQNKVPFQDRTHETLRARKVVIDMK